jgi:hypothetical protein
MFSPMPKAFGLGAVKWFEQALAGLSGRGRRSMTDIPDQAHLPVAQ